MVGKEKKRAKENERENLMKRRRVRNKWKEIKLKGIKQNSLFFRILSVSDILGLKSSIFY
jgi:hypothetical protein